MEKTEKGHIEDNEVTSSHKITGILLIILTLVVYITAVSFNYLSSFGGTGIFLNSTGGISDKYYVEVTPIGWVFGVIWGTIYIWNSIGLVYCLTTLCRRGNRSAYLYTYPSLTPPFMYIALMLNLICNVTWIFMWDRQIIDYSVIISALMAFFLYVAIFFTARATVQHEEEFRDIKMGIDVWLVRFCVHNALAFYATWVTIATLLNFSIALTYRAGLDQSVACTILLSILSVEILAWFVVDIFIFNRYVRYLFTPYVVICLALSGSMAKNWNPAARNSIFTASLLGVFGVLTIIKLVSIFWRPKGKEKIAHADE